MQAFEPTRIPDQTSYESFKCASFPLLSIIPFLVDGLLIDALCGAA